MTLRPIRRLLSGVSAAAVLSIATAAVAAAAPLWAASMAIQQAPPTVAAIPLFPGLTRESVETMPLENGGLLDDWGRSYPKLDGVKRTYVTTATPEEVYAFYEQRLGGKTEWTSEDDHTHIGPGQATPVQRTRHPHEFRATENLFTNRGISGAAQRQLLASHRPATPAGDWLLEGSFDWVVKDRRGAPTSFHVKVLDESVDTNWTRYTPRTVVEIYVETYGLMPDDDD